MYSYEDYLADFYETLRRHGFTPSVNALRDLVLGIPQPATREQFLVCQIEKMEPFARAGFKYLNRTRRGGRKGAQARWRNQEDQRNRIKQAAIALLKDNSRRGLARRIKQYHGLTLSVQQINNILRSIGV
jgi:hypothetical protein